MKRTIFIIIWTIFWLALESTLLSDFPANYLRFDFVFLGVIALGFFEEISSGLPFILLMGVFADAVSPAPFGITIFVYLSAFLSIRFAASTIYIHSNVARFFWTAAASIIALWIKALLTSLILKNPAYLVTTLWRFVPQTILNSVLAMAVIPFFKWYLDLTWEKIARPKGLVLK